MEFNFFFMIPKEVLQDRVMEVPSSLTREKPRINYGMRMVSCVNYIDWNEEPVALQQFDLIPFHVSPLSDSSGRYGMD